jgi:hypothetical protein
MMVDFHNLLDEFEHACRGGDYEISEQLKKQIVERLEKAERYEKVLKTIAEHEYCGSIGATGYYAEFKSMAKNALEGNEQ